MTDSELAEKEKEVRCVMNSTEMDAFLDGALRVAYGELKRF